MTRLFFSFLTVLVLISNAHAAGLSGPTGLQSTSILPKGIISPEFMTVITTPKNAYDESGIQKPLGDSLNQQITWQDVINAQPNVKDQESVVGTLQGNGISLDSSPGDSTGALKGAVNILAPQIRYGLTDDLTIAVAVPIYQVDVNVDTGFVRSDEGQKFINVVCGASTEKCNTATKQLNDSVNTKVQALGYDKVESLSFTRVGDIRLGAKYRMVKKGKNTIAVKPVVTVPTGTPRNVNRVIDVPTGDGQVDVGSDVIWDHQLSHLWRVNSYVGYNVQLPDKADQRVPTTAANTLSSDIDLVERDLGDQFKAGTSINWLSAQGGLGLGLGYSFQFQNRSGFTGNQFAKERYEYLSAQHPVQVLHSGTVMATFSTTRLYQNGQFFAPFQATASFSKPFLGRNVASNEVIGVDLILFF